MAQFKATSFDSYRQYLAQLREKAQQPEYQAYQSIVFSFLAISLFGWFAIRPTIQTIIQLRREIADKTVVSQAMSDKISSLIDAQTSLLEVRNQVPLIDQALPRPPDVVSLVDQLTKLVNDSSATVSAVSVAKTQLVIPPQVTQVSPTIAPDNNESPALGNPNSVTSNALVSPTAEEIGKITITLNIAGSYSSLETAIERLQNLRRIVSIQSVNFTIPKTQSTVASVSKDLTLDVRLESYYLGK